MVAEKFRQNILALMAKRNLNEAQLAREINVPQPTMHKLMSGATIDPRISTLQPIAKFFNISIDQLVGAAPLNSEAAPQAENKSSSERRRLPVLSWEQVKEYQQVIKKLNAANWSDWIVLDESLSKEVYAARIKNCSFIAPFSNDSIVIVNPTKALANGSYVVLKPKNNHTVTIKKCVFDGDDIWLITLLEGIQPVLWNQENWINYGSIIEVRIPLSKEDSHES